LNAFETLMQNVMDVVYIYALHFLLFLCIKYVFFCFYQKVALKANVKYTMKRCIMSATECTVVAAFTFTAT